MPSLKKQFPFSEGWIHAKLTLEKGHGLTVENLKENWKGFPGPADAEFGHVEIEGNKAVVISRSPKKEAAAVPSTRTNHGASIPL